METKDRTTAGFFLLILVKWKKILGIWVTFAMNKGNRIGNNMNANEDNRLKCKHRILIEILEIIRV